MRPDLFSDVLERVNVLHFATDSWLSTLTAKLRLSYPMISYVQLGMDHRIDKAYEVSQLEADLKDCYY